MTEQATDIAAAVRALLPRVGSGMTELALDLEAIWPLNALADVDGWITRPAILRRVASVIADRIGADVDRIVTVGPGAEALGAALALRTGLPFATRGDAFDRGEVRPGESIFVAAALTSSLADAGPAGSPGEVRSTFALVADTAEVPAIFRLVGSRLVPDLPIAEQAERDELVRLASGMLTTGDAQNVWLETAASPARLARLGERIARAIAPLAPEAIACWRDDDEAALAQSVAQVLAIPITRADIDLGLLSLAPPLPDAAQRVLMLAATWDDYLSASGLAAALRNGGREPVAAISLFGPTPEVDLPVIVLGART